MLTPVPEMFAPRNETLEISLFCSFLSVGSFQILVLKYSQCQMNGNTMLYKQRKPHDTNL